MDKQSLSITIPHLRCTFFYEKGLMAVEPRSPAPKHSGQSYHARYNESEENIFLQLQKHNPPERKDNSSTAGIRIVNYAVFPLYHQLGIPDSDTTSYMEPRYIAYLLQEVPDTLGAGQMFPAVFPKLYAHALNHEGLRYTMLAVASFLTDNKNNRPPLYAFKYLQMGIGQIQQALTEGTITDALIYAVFFAAYLHFICGELASTRRHLEGFHLLLQRYQTPPAEFQPVITPPAELMFVWRMAIRMDHTWAIGGRILVFPLVSKQDELHRGWVGKLVEGENHDVTVEWALAQFALDDLLTRAIALNMKAVQLRSQPGYDKEIVEAAIEQETTILLEEHRSWNERPCVRSAREQDVLDDSRNQAPQPFHTTSSTFLHYTKLHIRNQLYAANLIQHYWVLIYITFISHSDPGPSPHKRFQTAIELCRTSAAVGSALPVGVCRMILGFYLAGLTSSERMYPTGSSDSFV